MLKFEINQETGDLVLTTDHGMIIIDQRDRDYLQDQLRYSRQDENPQDHIYARGYAKNPDIIETKEALKSKLALYELYQDQEYWANKWQNQNTASMRQYVNFHTADKARDAAIKSGLDLDDLLLF